MVSNTHMNHKANPKGRRLGGDHVSPVSLRGRCWLETKRPTNRFALPHYELTVQIQTLPYSDHEKTKKWTASKQAIGSKRIASLFHALPWTILICHLLILNSCCGLVVVVGMSRLMEIFTQVDRSELRVRFELLPDSSSRISCLCGVVWTKNGLSSANFRSSAAPKLATSNIFEGGPGRRPETHIMAD